MGILCGNLCLQCNWLASYLHKRWVELECDYGSSVLNLGGVLHVSLTFNIEALQDGKQGRGSAAEENAAGAAPGTA